MPLKKTPDEFNTCLSEAAPELLEACKLLLATVQDFMPNVGICVLQDYARLNAGLIKGEAAIAKATMSKKTSTEIYYATKKD